jgi:hypothetical protein
MVCPERIELPTFWSATKRAIRLRYGHTFKVGVTGLEPAFSCSQGMWATITRHSETYGGTGGYRDRDTLCFKQVLYHSELQCQNSYSFES